MTYRLVNRHTKAITDVGDAVEYAGRDYKIYDLEPPASGEPMGGVKIEFMQEVIEVEPTSIGCRWLWIL